MLRRACLRFLTGVAVVALPIVGVVPGASATVEPAQETQQTVLYYDHSQAAEFTDEVEAGMEVWNSEVENVRLEPVQPGQQANIVIIADDGWPRAELGPVRPGGQVTWWFGRQAGDQGHDPIRTAAHETGHSLGLPDMKPGPCSSLMSGSSAGVGCTNAIPDASEQQLVEDNYGTGAAGRTPADGRIVVDKP